jgi:hypothetical protein
VVYLTPKIERIIVLLSASPEGEARLPMPKGMAYKELLLLFMFFARLTCTCAWTVPPFFSFCGICTVTVSATAKLRIRGKFLGSGLAVEKP